MFTKSKPIHGVLLTWRQRQYLKFIAKNGYSNGQIAAKTGTSIATVKAIITQLYSRIREMYPGVQQRTSVAAWFYNPKHFSLHRAS